MQRGEKESKSTANYVDTVSFAHVPAEALYLCTMHMSWNVIFIRLNLM